MIKAAIFDKDGTLFDFRASWGAWTRAVIAELAPDGPDAARLAAALGYDLLRDEFHPDSVVIAHTTHEIAVLVAELLGEDDLEGLIARMDRLAAQTPMAPAVDLPEVFSALRTAGIRIGLATNDTEAPARSHLERAGVLDLFDFVAGSDSGWGGKPGPGQLLAFARAIDVEPAAIAMVGDSAHDMEAGRRAGMARVAVLTGIATAPDLAPHAEVVLPDISHLKGWITAQNGG